MIISVQYLEHDFYKKIKSWKCSRKSLEAGNTKHGCWRTKFFNGAVKNTSWHSANNGNQ